MNSHESKIRFFITAGLLGAAATLAVCAAEEQKTATPTTLNPTPVSALETSAVITKTRLPVLPTRVRIETPPITPIVSLPEVFPSIDFLRKYINVLSFNSSGWGSNEPASINIRGNSEFDIFLHARETAFVPFRIKPGHSLSLDAVFIAGCEVQFKIFPPKQINKNTGYPMNGAKEIALITGRHDRKGDTRFIKAVHFVGAKNLGPLEEDWLTAWTDIQPNPQCFSSWLRVTVGEKE